VNAALSICALIALGIWLVRIKKYRLNASFFHYKKVLLHTSDRFGEVWIAQQNHLRTLQFDGLDQNVQTCCDLVSSRKVVFFYQKMILMISLLSPKPMRICIIGLGGGTLTMHLRYLYPSAYLVHVEINARMLDYAKKFFFFQADDRMEFHFTDAASFFQTEIGYQMPSFDLIILDAFDRNATPTRFFHRGFYQGLSSKLNEQGLLIGNTFYDSIHRNRETLLYKNVFQTVLSCPPIDPSERNQILIAFHTLHLQYPQLETRIAFLAHWLDHMDMPEQYWKKWLYKILEPCKAQSSSEATYL